MDELLLPSEVAVLFGVDPKTVTRWARSGRLPYVRTLGGHRRYPKAKIYELTNTPLEEPAEPAAS